MVPDYETLSWIVKEKEPEGIERERMVGLIELIKKSEIRDITYIQEYALEFCRKQAIKKGLMERRRSINRWNPKFFLEFLILRIEFHCRFK